MLLSYLVIKLKFVKKIFFLTIFLTSLLGVTVVKAQTTTGLTVGTGYQTGLITQLQASAGLQGANYGVPNDPRLAAANIIKIFLGLIGVVLAAYAVYAGFLIMMSGGQEEKIAKGKTVMRHAVIGLFIILSAYGILALTVRLVSGNCFTAGGNCDFFAGSTDKYGAGGYVGIQESVRTNPDPGAQDFYPGDRLLLQ